MSAPGHARPATPLVTIGIPVHNGGHYLPATLAALRDQTLSDFELIISDNGSTDGTPDVGRAAAAADPRIRYVRHETNQGAAWNYNHLVSLARSRYFKWNGHDDICLPDYLARCVGALEDNPEAVLCYPRTMLIDATGVEIGPYEDGLNIDATDPGQRVRQYLLRISMANAVFGVHRLEVLRRSHLIGAYNSSDQVLLYELALRGQFMEIPARLFLRRVHDASSLRANTTPTDVRQWFTGAATAPSVVFPRTRLLGELVRASLTADIPLAGRLSALKVLMATWARRDRRRITGELYRGIRGQLRASARRSRPTTTD